MFPSFPQFHSGSKSRIQRCKRERKARIRRRQLRIEALEHRQLLTSATAVVSATELVGMQLLYAVNDNNFDFNDAYTVNNSGSIPAGSFTRVGYFVELGGNWVYAEMDTFNTNPTLVGVPKAGTNIVQNGTLVTNLNVESNHPSVAPGTGLNGIIEFWASNYGPSGGGAYGSNDGKFDWKDSGGTTSGGHGSFQASYLNSARTSGGTLFNITAGGGSGIGVQSPEGSNGSQDWTFGPASSTYGVRNLEIWVGNSNAPPTIANLDGDTFNYVPGVDGVQVIDQGTAAVADDPAPLGLNGWNGGNLTVGVPAGGVPADDVLAILHEGSGAGQIGVSGANISYQGTAIGTVAGGTSGADLVVTFTSDATTAAVSALLDNVTYWNANAATTPSTRLVRFTLTDGDGASSVPSDTTIVMDVGGAVTSFVWDGSGDGSSFSDPANWAGDPASGPDANDIAIFRTADPGVVDLGGVVVYVGEIRFDGSGSYSLQNGTLGVDKIDQQAAASGDNVIAAQLSSVALDGRVAGGSLHLTNTSNNTSLLSGSWTVNAGARLRAAAASSSSGLGAAAVAVVLNGGALEIDSAAASIADALGHVGYHVNNDAVALDLNNNAGVVANGDPTSYPGFEGLGTLTSGPGSRGLDFNSDSDFTSVPASLKDDASGDGVVITNADNYSNLWIGTLTPNATGTWGFRNNDNDDIAAMWIDLDQDGVFESSTPGLGDNRGEQVIWENTTNHTRTLTSGEKYLVAVLHREGGGGSGIDMRFTPPASTERVVKPADAAQAGLWSFTDQTTVALGNDVTVSASSTIIVDGGVSLGALTLGAGASQLDVESDHAEGTLAGRLTFTGATTLDGAKTFQHANQATLILQGAVQNGAAAGAITKTGDGALILAGANTYSGDTTIASGVIALGNNSGLGSVAGKTVIQSGATLDIRGFRAGADGNEAVEAIGTGANGAGAIVNTGASQTFAFRNLTMTGDATFRSDNRWDVKDDGSDPVLFDMNGFTLTKVGSAELVLYNTTVMDPGSVNVNQATFRLEGSTAFGGPGTISVVSGATLDFWSNIQTHSVNVALAGGANLTTNDGAGAGPTVTGTLTLNGIANFNIEKDITFSGQVTGAGGINKITGTGSMTLGNNLNDYGGATTVGAGTLVAATANALGSPSQGTIVNSGATLLLNAASGAFTSAEPLTVQGMGVGNAGVLQSSGNSVTLTADVALSDDSFIASNTAGAALTLAGTLTKDVPSDLTLQGPGDFAIQSDIGNGSFSLAPITARAFNGVQQAIDTASVITNDINGTTAATRTATLNGNLQFANAAAFNALFTPSIPLGDNFTTVFETTMTVTTPGIYSFSVTNNDDGAAVWLKPSANVSFVAGDKLQGIVANSNTTVATRTLAAGTYTLVYAHREGGGGEAVTGRIGGPAFNGVTNGTLLPLVNPTLMSGTDQLIKTGSGTAILSGANSYSGVTLVHQGALIASADSALGSAAPVSGDVTVGALTPHWQVGTDNGGSAEFSQENGSSNAAPGSATARDDDWYFAGAYPSPIGTLAANEALGGGPATGFERALTVGDPTDRIHFNLAADQLDDNFNLVIDTVGSSFTGGSITLQVLFNGVSVHTQTISGDGTLTTATFTGATVGAIAGDNVVTLTRTGSGQWLQLDYVRLNRQVAIYGVADTQVESGATLGFDSVSYTVPETVYLNGGAIQATAGTGSFAGAVELLVDSTLDAATGASLNLSGVVDDQADSFALAKSGDGTIILSGANSYDGSTTVQAGVLVAAHDSALGSTTGSTTVGQGATLAIDGTLHGDLTIAENLTIFGAGDGGAGALRNMAGNNTITGDVVAQEYAAPTLTVSAGLELWLDAANTAAVVAADGSLDSGDAISAWNDVLVGDNTVANGGTQATAANRPIWNANVVNGQPAIQFDGLDTADGDRLDLAGTLNLTTNATIFFVALDGPQSSNGASALRPVLSDRTDYGNTGYTIAFRREGGGQPAIRVDKASVADTDNVTIMDTISLGTAPDNAFHFYTLSSSASSTQFYEDGVLLRSSNLTSTPAATTYDVGGNRTNNARHYRGSIAEIIAFNGALSAADRAAVEDYLRTKYFLTPPSPGDPTITSAQDTLTINGNVSLPNLMINGAGNTIINGVMQDAAPDVGTLTKDGSGTLILAGDNTYSGGTTVDAGTLLVNNASGSGAGTGNVAVNNGATLGGSGTIIAAVLMNNVSSGTTLSPGSPVDAPADLAVGNLTLSAGSTYAVQVDGPAAGSGYDQVVVTGTVNLGGSRLTLTGTYVAPVGALVTILAKDGVDAVVGEFVGMPDESLVNVGGLPFRIDYQGGTGNDVVLIRVPFELNQLVVDAGQATSGDDTLRATGTDVAIQLGLQHSTITRMMVTLDGVLAGWEEGAFKLEQLGLGGGAVGLNVAPTLVGGSTVVTLTFQAGTGVYQRAAAHDFALIDGDFKLTIDAGKLHDVEGDLAAGRVDNFFRFFGDSDGDRDVDGMDMNRLRRVMANDPLFDDYKAAFDHDGSDSVNTFDYTQFRAHYGKKLRPAVGAFQQGVISRLVRSPVRRRFA
jgi:autotransporter-associated beta strand protein